MRNYIIAAIAGLFFGLISVAVLLVTVEENVQRAVQEKNAEIERLKATCEEKR